MMTVREDAVQLRRLRVGDKIRWYARIVPLIAVASYYAIVSITWGRAAVEHSHEAINGAWLDNGVAAIHAVSAAIFFAVICGIMFCRKDPVYRERRILGWTLPLVAVLALGAVGIGDTNDLSTAMSFVSTAIVLMGAGYTLYALRHLGRHFGVVPDVRGLVTSGPYRFVRHPLYLGETAIAFGVLLAVLSPFTIIAFTVWLAAQLGRAKLEEQSITQVFPVYRDYAARTPMLIPFLRVPRWSRQNAPGLSPARD